MWTAQSGSWGLPGRPALRAQAPVPSQPARHGPGGSWSRAGSGAWGMWVCEATTSGCDGRASPTPWG